MLQPEKFSFLNNDSVILHKKILSLQLHKKNLLFYRFFQCIGASSRRIQHFGRLKLLFFVAKSENDILAFSCAGYIKSVYFLKWRCQAFFLLLVWDVDYIFFSLFQWFVCMQIFLDISEQGKKFGKEKLWLRVDVALM